MRRVRWAAWGEHLLTALQFAIVLADVLAWGGLITFVLRDFLPLWAALGIAVLVALGIVPVLVWEYGKTLMEIAVGAFIGLILAAILWPVFARAREQRLHHQRLHHQTKAASVRSPGRHAA